MPAHTDDSDRAYEAFVALCQEEGLDPNAPQTFETLYLERWAFVPMTVVDIPAEDIPF